MSSAVKVLIITELFRSDKYKCKDDHKLYVLLVGFKLNKTKKMKQRFAIDWSIHLQMPSFLKLSTLVWVKKF